MPAAARIDLKTPAPRALFAVSAIIVLIGTVYPFLITGFFHDDSINSALAGHLNRNSMGLFAYCLKLATHWMETASRFYPLSFFLGYPAAYFFQEAWQSRAFQILMVTVDFGLLASLLRSSGRSSREIFLAVAIVLACFQIRPYYDPVTGFSGLLQINLAFGLLAIRFAQAYLLNDT
ncbi:MAG: hypothetical protein AAB425_15770, partial [Bdellovibrionota bacterium]